MKNYKVGDTIYIKDMIVAINIDDTISAYRGGYNGWLSNRTIIDELPTAESVKPVLTEKVVLSKEQAKIVEEARLSDVPATYISERTPSYDEEPLMRAYVNGYTVEQEPRYKVYVTGTNKQFMYLKRGGWAKVDNKKATPITPQSISNYLTAGGNRDLYWFTDEEITKFDLQDCEKELVADD